MEDIRKEYGRKEDGIWNRALNIPRGYKGRSFEKYDDVILRDNDERKEKRKLATESMLPSPQKIIKEQDYYDLPALVSTFRSVVESHISGIKLVQQDVELICYKFEYATLRGYDEVCKKILQVWELRSVNGGIN